MSDLKHYGIPGMHWGVRKSTFGKAAGIAKDAGAAARGLKGDKTKQGFQSQVKSSGGLHKVSDKDLQNMLNRMNMEQQYRQFMEKESKRRSEGASAALKALGKIGAIVIPLFAGGVAAKAAPTVIKVVSESQRALGR